MRRHTFSLLPQYFHDESSIFDDQADDLLYLFCSYKRLIFWSQFTTLFIKVIFGCDMCMIAKRLKSRLHWGFFFIMSGQYTSIQNHQSLCSRINRILFRRIDDGGSNGNFSSFDLGNGRLQQEYRIDQNGSFEARIDLGGKSRPRTAFSSHQKGDPSDNIVKQTTHAPSMTISRMRFGSFGKVTNATQGGSDTTSRKAGNSRPIIGIVFEYSDRGIFVVNQISSL
jgi:hypothetical protein